MVAVQRNLLIAAVALTCVLTACRPTRQAVVGQRVQQLIEQSERLLDEEDIDSAWALLLQAYACADSAQSAEGMAQACLAMARHHNMMDRPDSALACLQKGLPYTADAGSNRQALAAQCYAELSATYNVLGDMGACVQWARQALPLIRQWGSDEDYAILCGNTGIAYRRLGNNDSAAVLYQQGLEVAVAAADYGSEAYLANNLSVLYAEMGRLSESILYAEKASAAATRAGDDVERLSAEAAKGIALLLDQRADQAVDVLIPAFAQADSTHSTPLKLKTINYLLKALVTSKRWDEARHYLQRGQLLAAALPPTSTAAAGILESQMILQAENGQYAEALQTIARLEELCRIQQVIPRHKLISQKAVCMAGLGRYHEAYSLQALASTLSDSLHNAASDAKLDQLTTSYRVMEKELEVSRLSQRQAESQRKISLLIAALALLLTVLTLLSLWMRSRRRQAKLRETRKYVEGIEQERTRFAHELHDGACNELLAIGMQLNTRQPADEFVTRIHNQVTTLRAYLRNLSHELMPPQFANGVCLNEALAYYLSHIEQPQVQFHAEGSGWGQIPPNTSYQIYRIVQEAIGNIIVHQPTAQVHATLIYNKVEARPGNRRLQLDITSLGAAIQGDGKGIGLQSIADRASSIGARIDTSYHSEKFTLALSCAT